MSDLDNEIRRGFEAERILREPLLIEAFEVIESSIYEGMKKSKIGDSKTHTDLVMALQTLEGIKNSLRTVIETGKMATIQKETMLQRAKKALRAV